MYFSVFTVYSLEFQNVYIVAAKWPVALRTGRAHRATAYAVIERKPLAVV